MANDYGKTWWGREFLNSLSKIDYSNRLPRGRSYARNGYVKEIKIKENIVSAKVRGSRPTPYKITITLPLFSASQNKALMKEIKGNAMLLSFLLSRELPPDINEIAQKNKITVFPSSWRDFEMKCSCPDWAVPCKHLAAVIYILSAEIDRNPFQIFQLHGLDILKELEKGGMSLGEEMQVPEFSRLLQKKPVAISADEIEGEGGFDLSAIPPLAETLLSLLGEECMFYSRPFAPLMRKSYRKVSRHARRLLEKEVVETPLRDYEEYEKVEFIMHNEVHFFDAVLLSDAGERHFSATRNGFPALMEFLAGIPGKHFAMIAPPLELLCRAYHLGLKLAEMGGFIPQLMKLSDQSHVIRWVPAALNEEVEELVSQLEKQVTENIVLVMGASGKPSYLSRREQSVTLLSHFIGHCVIEAMDLFSDYHKTLNDRVENLFFCGSFYKFDQLGEQEIPGAIFQWLSRYYIANKEFTPVLQVQDNEAENLFEVQILVENRKDSLLEPIPLDKFMNSQKHLQALPGVLHSLANLARDFPDIGRVVSAPGEVELVYDSAEFVEVLLKILPVMKLLGMRILLPNSLKELARPQITMQLNKKESSADGKSYLNLDEMLDFQWQIAIGDKSVPIDEFRQLVQGLSGVVNIKGQYVLVDQAQIQTLLNNLDENKKVSSSEMLKAALSEEYEEAKVSISPDARNIIRELLEAEGKKPPATLKAELRPYQERGFQWLYNNSAVGFGSIIADDMGLGKTLQVISLLLQFKHEGRLEKEKALIVVPTTLITNWEREIAKFAEELVPFVYHGTKRRLETEGSDLVLTSYGVLRSDVALLQKVKWTLVAIDEAQNIKNPGTEQTKAVKKIKAPIRIAMSGTPVENRLSEYWSIFDFTNKGYLGSAKHFKKEFAVPIEVDNCQRRLENFKKITSPFILRRVKTDKSIISDLPDKIENDRFVQLTKDQTALYQNVVNSMMKEVQEAEGDKIKRSGLVFKLMTALKQVCNHPSHFLKKEGFQPDMSGKAEMLISILDEIYERGEKALVFTQYREMGDLLEKMIGERFGNTCQFLHGGISRKQRDEMVTDFQQKRRIKTFILSIKAGGTGLNLTEANHVIHYDLWWNPAVEAQATDRAFRIGQERNVMVHRLITKGTFEEKINEMLVSKKALADLTVTAGEKWVGDLSQQEISELVKL